MVVPSSKSVLYTNLLIPSTVTWWNTLPVNAQQSTSLSEFIRFLSTADVTVSAYYYTGERSEQISHCRLRLGMSNLNNDLFKRHIHTNSNCHMWKHQTNSWTLSHPQFKLQKNPHTPQDWISIETLLHSNPILCFQENDENYFNIQNCAWIDKTV